MAFLRSIALATLAVLLAVAGVVPVAAAPASASASAADALPVIAPVRSSAGFVHPGLAVSASSLELARRQVRAGIEPWASYYAAMTATTYASKTFSSRNQGSVVDRPGSSAFNSQGVESKFIDDAFRAYTQAILYFLTGDPVYRENALKLIRIWAHMDPNAYVYYPDAHIHSGAPLLRMLAAAELLRYSTVTGPAADGYDPDLERRRHHRPHRQPDRAADADVPVPEPQLHGSAQLLADRRDRGIHLHRQPAALP